MTPAATRSVAASLKQHLGFLGPPPPRRVIRSTTSQIKSGEEKTAADRGLEVKGCHSRVEETAMPSSPKQGSDRKQMSLFSELTSCSLDLINTQCFFTAHPHTQHHISTSISKETESSPDSGSSRAHPPSGSQPVRHCSTFLA